MAAKYTSGGGRRTLELSRGGNGAGEDIPECLAPHAPESTVPSRRGTSRVVYVPTLTETDDAPLHRCPWPLAPRLLFLRLCTTPRPSVHTEQLDVALRWPHDRRLAGLPHGLAAIGLAGGGRRAHACGPRRRHHLDRQLHQLRADARVEDLGGRQQRHLLPRRRRQ